MKKYYVYIISNSKLKPLYIGVSNDLSRRMDEHRGKLVQGFSSRYNLNRLLWYEEFDDINEAISREKQLKNWHREWKLNLIKSENSRFVDLASYI